MTPQSAALTYLNDRVFYADMIDSVERGVAQILTAGPTGVLLDAGHGTVMMSAADSPSARRLLDMIGPDTDMDHMVVHESFCVPLAQQMFGFTRITTCTSAVYAGPPLPWSPRADLRLATLGDEWAETISANYHKGDLNYVHERLDAHVMIGAFAGDELAGFIGQHEEGSMGLLVVFPQYQRRGIATHLLTYLVNKLLSEGRMPYDQIESGNEISETLHRSLGFAISTRQLYWLSTGY